MLGRNRLDLRLLVVDNVYIQNGVRGHRKRWQGCTPMEHKFLDKRRITM